MPVSEIKKNNVEDIVKAILSKDKANAYSIMGLMVEGFGVAEDDLNGKPFSQWKPGYPTLYTKIRLTLQRLVKEGKLESRKNGKAVVYWWSGHELDAIDRVSDFGRKPLFGQR